MNLDYWPGKYAGETIEMRVITTTGNYFQTLGMKLTDGRDFMGVKSDAFNTILNEVLVGKLDGIFAGLAIFISCLGLFGLATFVAQQRTKEIGIRKVLRCYCNSRMDAIKQKTLLYWLYSVA